MIFTNRDLIFDGYNFSSILYVEKIRRPLMQPTENSYLTIGNKGIHRKSRRVPYTLEVDIRLIESTRDDVTEKKRLLASKLYKTKPCKLELRDDSRFELATIDGQIDFERLMRTGFATLTFLIYGASYGLYKIQAVTNSITVTGTDETYPVIKITPTATQPLISVQNTTTGEKITLQKSINAGQVVQIGSIVDYSHRQSVTVAGVSAMKDVSLISDFPKLVPGINNIIITGATTATFEYWERFI